MVGSCVVCWQELRYLLLDWPVIMCCQLLLIRPLVGVLWPQEIRKFLSAHGCLAAECAGLVGDCCVYIGGKRRLLNGLQWQKFSLITDKKFLFCICNNEISHYNDPFNTTYFILWLRSISKTIQRELIHLENNSCLDNRKEFPSICTRTLWFSWHDRWFCVFYWDFSWYAMIIPSWWMGCGKQA